MDIFDGDGTLLLEEELDEDYEPNQEGLRFILLQKSKSTKLFITQFFYYFMK